MTSLIYLLLTWTGISREKASRVLNRSKICQKNIVGKNMLKNKKTILKKVPRIELMPPSCRSLSKDIFLLLLSSLKILFYLVEHETCWWFFKYSQLFRWLQRYRSTSPLSFQCLQAKFTKQDGINIIYFNWVSSLLSPVGTWRMTTCWWVWLFGREHVTSRVPLVTNFVARRCSCCNVEDGRMNMSPPAAIVTPPFSNNPNSFSSSWMIPLIPLVFICLKDSPLLSLINTGIGWWFKFSAILMGVGAWWLRGFWDNGGRICLEVWKYGRRE